MAESSASASVTRGAYLRAPDASPSFAQTTAEFSLDSDLDLEEDEDSGDDELRLREAELGGGEAYELRHVRKSQVGGGEDQDGAPGASNDEEDEEEDSDGWVRTNMPGHRRASVSTVASFQLYTPDEERAVVKKFDRKLVLFVALLYMLSFLDRSNIGNAAIAGMDEDLQTDPPWDGWYDWALTAFYISYISFEWMSLLWKVIPAHIFVSVIVMSWGVTASLQAVSVSYPMLIALRVLLGIGEAGFTGIPFYLSFFFKRDELAFRTAIFISAAPLATSFASSLAWLIVKLGRSSPIAPWRLLFLLEGFPSVLVAILAWRLIPDSPQTASYLTRRERKVARLRLRNEKAQHHHHRDAASAFLAGIGHGKTEEDEEGDVGGGASTRLMTTSGGDDSGTGATGLKLREVLATLADPFAWLTAAMFFLANLAYSSLPVFLPKILTQMGHDRLSSQGLSAPPYLAAFLLVLLTARLSDRLRSRSIPIVIHALASAAGYAVLALAKPLNLGPAVRYAAVYPAAAGFFNVVTLLIAWNINNQASESRQGGGFALFQLVGQCGPLVGTRLYPESDGPFYETGMRVCAGAMLGVAALALALRLYMRRRNRQLDMARDRGGTATVAVGESAEEEEGLVASGPEGRTSGRGRAGRTAAGRFRYML